MNPLVVSWLLAVCFTLLPACCVSECLFDEINLDLHTLPKTEVHYGHTRVARDVSSKQPLYQPIRIHVHFDRPEPSMQHVEVLRLEMVISKAVRRIRELLLVIPTQQPLLLQRTRACVSRWSHGPNRGKCARVQSTGEFCENKIDYFQIPEQFLAGLEVYGSDDTRPQIASLPSGLGARDADFVLFVTTRSSHWCQNKNVIAYASFCQLDQMDRPVAGLVNFCPYHTKSSVFDEHKAELAVLHELLHVLGFSQELFSRFKDCVEIENERFCTPRKRFVIGDSDQNLRLVLPSVIREMQTHLDCARPDIGAPLERQERQGPKGLASHWDPLMMFGSIMAPTLGEPEFTSLDPITAAVFADTGWYQVNFSSTDLYLWGKGKGCDFGTSQMCIRNTSDDREFCELAKSEGTEAGGCDYLHVTRTHCQPVEGTDRVCGVYKPHMAFDCRREPSFIEQTGEDFPVRTSFGNRCFVTDVAGQRQGSCFQYRCHNQSTLQVYVGDTWKTCPPRTSIPYEISGVFGKLFCPKIDTFCIPHHRHLKKGSFPNIFFGEWTISENVPEDFITVEILFDSPTQWDLQRSGSQTFVEFERLVKAKVSTAAGVPLSWLHVTTQESGSHILMKVIIRPPNDAQVTEEWLRDIYFRLEQFAEDRQLTFPFKRDIKASALSIRLKPDPQEGDRSMKDVASLVIIIAVVLSTIVVAAGLLGVLQEVRKSPRGTTVV